MGKKKFYVVWNGVEPGIYTSWTDCQLQTKGYAGAKFKSFESQEEAEKAFATTPYDYYKKVGRTASKAKKTFDPDHLPPQVVPNSLAVDAACSGNPGPMEYRGVYVGNGQELFHFGPIQGTNNIGEFLAIVHGLAMLKQQQCDMVIYSDSRNAISWVKNKKCKTRLERNASTEKVFNLIERAEKWLRENSYNTSIQKWETKEWGEIPADFGRK